MEISQYTIRNPELDSGSKEKILTFVRIASRILAIPLLVLIWIYQHTLSPDHGPFRYMFPYGYCQFHPSCSQYAKITLQEDGIIGLPKVIWRLIQCR